ncbi:MAG: glycosyltransferase, partial [Chloroflexi bacterium]
IGETVDEARRAAIRMAEGPYVCILHADTVPLEPGWLARMIDVMESRDAGVVGARLVLPRRPGPPTAPLAEPPDLTLESRGIELDAAGGLPRPRHVGAGEDPRAAEARSTGTVPAVASACLLVRRADLDPVDDLLVDDAAWAVDLCLRLRAQGRTVAYAGDAVLWHAGQAEASDDPTIDSTGPWDAFDRRWARRLFREVLRDRVRGTGDWAGSPIHVAITVTRNDDGIPYGDAYTARELGDALRALGWRVSYIERYKDHWYDLDPSVDVVIALLDLFDVRRVPRHVVKVAWVRNWADRWLSHPWFDDYDLVFGVSGPVQRVIRERSAKVAHLMPLATNEARFRPAAEDPALSTDVVFVGSNWGEERGVARALPALASDGVRTRLFGRGWEDVPGMTGVAGGVLPYERVPDAYASAAIVIDDTASPTRPYGAVNARVFDALAAGRIVVSDNAEGVRELFDADFPVWDDPSTLKSQVRELLADPDRRGELARRYRKEVLGRHTYSHRAAELRERLLEWADRPHVAIHIGPRDWEQAQGWGDTAFGRAVQRQFERAGWPAAVLVHAEAEDPVAVRADVALHVFGVRAPTVRPDQASLLWIISHPDRVTADLCDRYDRVFVASDVFLARLQARVGVPLMPLHQASDPERFYPDPTGPSHQLLFVGNSRKVHRPVLDFLAGTPWDLAVYGQNWTPDLLDPKFLKGEWIPNEDVRHYYSSAEIVLNDHWQDMRDDGFISNRVYDALASGAFVVSDHVPGIDEEFDGGVVTYEDRQELLAKIERYLADPRERRALAERGRRAVLERHTFEHRVRAILAAIEPLLERRPMAVTPTDVTGAAAG